MQSFKRTVLTLATAILFAAVAFAQGEPPPTGPGPEPINWLMYAALGVNAALVPLAADVLKRYMPMLPGWVKTVLPLMAGSLITMAEAQLLGVFGGAIDLTLIEQVILGGGVAGLGATLAFKKGEAHGVGKA